MPRAKNAKRSDGRLQAKVYLGIIDGKAKYKYVYASTQKELNAKIDEIKLQIGKGLDVSAQRDTFGEWAKRWLKLKKTEVSDHRLYIYECRIKNLSSLNFMEIPKIRSMDIQDIIIELSEDYSKSVLKEIKSTVHQILQLAVDNRVIDYNPASAVKIPNKQEDKAERRALNEEEQHWIVDTPHRAQTAAMLMMYAGLRRGEVVPLLWTDIDLDAGTIKVTKSMSRSGSKWTVKQGAKTEAGIRTVYIPQILTEYLKSIDRGNSFIVCPDSTGRTLSLSAWEKMWDSYISELNFKYGDFSKVVVPDKHGNLQPFKKPKSRFAPVKIPIVIPRITPHWLRHTFITSMYLAGVDVLTAKEQAGHSDISTTMAIYTHLDALHKIKQIDKLNEYYGCQMGVNDKNKQRNIG